MMTVAERFNDRILDLRMVATLGGKWNDLLGLFYFPDGSTGYLGPIPCIESPYGRRIVAWPFIASDTARPPV